MTTLTVTYEVAGGVNLTLDSGDGHTRSVGLSGSAAGELLHRDPIAWTAFNQYKATGAETGTVTVSAG